MKTITSILLSVLLSVLLCVMPCTTYKTTASVTAIDGDLVTVNIDGDAFTFYGNGYHIGETVTVTVDGNATADRTDDAIIDAIG